MRTILTLLALIAIVSQAGYNPSTGAIDVSLESLVASSGISFVIDHNRRVFDENFLNCAATSTGVLTVSTVSIKLNVTLIEGSGNGDLALQTAPNEGSCGGIINYRHCARVEVLDSEESIWNSTDGIVTLACKNIINPNTEWQTTFNFSLADGSAGLECSALTVPIYVNETSQSPVDEEEFVPFRLGVRNMDDIAYSSFISSIRFIANESASIFSFDGESSTIVREARGMSGQDAEEPTTTTTPTSTTITTPTTTTATSTNPVSTTSTATSTTPSGTSETAVTTSTAFTSTSIAPISPTTHLVFFCPQVGDYLTSAAHAKSTYCQPLTQILFDSTPAPVLLSGYFLVNRSSLINTLQKGPTSLVFEANTSTSFCRGSITFSFKNASSNYFGSLSVDVAHAEAIPRMTDGDWIIGAGGASLTLPLFRADSLPNPSALVANVVEGASTCLLIHSTTANAITLRTVHGYGPCRATVSVTSADDTTTPLLVGIASVGIAVNASGTQLIDSLIARRWKSGFSLQEVVNMIAIPAIENTSVLAYYPKAMTLAADKIVRNSTQTSPTADLVFGMNTYKVEVLGQRCALSNDTVKNTDIKQMTIPSIASPFSIYSQGSDCIFSISSTASQQVASFAVTSLKSTSYTPVGFSGTKTMTLKVPKSSSQTSTSPFPTHTLSRASSTTKVLTKRVLTPPLPRTASMTIIPPPATNVTNTSTSAPNGSVPASSSPIPNTTAAPPSTTHSSFEDKSDDGSSGTKAFVAIVIIVIIVILICIAVYHRKRLVELFNQLRGKESNTLGRGGNFGGGDTSVDRPPRDIYASSDDEGNSVPMQMVRNPPAIPKPGYTSSASAANTAAAVAAATVNFNAHNRPAEGSSAHASVTITPTGSPGMRPGSATSPSILPNNSLGGGPTTPQSPHSRAAAILKPIGRPKSSFAEGSASGTQSTVPAVPKAKIGLGLGTATRLEGPIPSPTFETTAATPATVPTTSPQQPASSANQGWDVDDFFTNPAPATTNPGQAASPNPMPSNFSPLASAPITTAPVGSSLSQIPWGNSTSSAPPRAQQQQQQPSNTQTGWENTDNFFE